MARDTSIEFNWLQTVQSYLQRHPYIIYLQHLKRSFFTSNTDPNCPYTTYVPNALLSLSNLNFITTITVGEEYKS